MPHEKQSSTIHWETIKREAKNINGSPTSNEEGPIKESPIASVEQEQWRKVVGWGKYEVSSLGRVRRKGKILSTFIVQGYVSFNVSNGEKRKSLRVHRQMLRSFVGESELLCRHIDGNRTRNTLDNIAYGTSKENENDKLAHGRRLLGEKHHQAKLSESDVLDIRNSMQRGVDLSKRYGVCPTQICKIRKRKSWAHIF
jgi:hypothetical protein